MRLRRQDLRTVYRRARITTFDTEGNPVKSWGPATALLLNVQPASGQLNASMYGERLRYMKAIKYQGTALVEGRDEGNGLCIYVGQDEDPDYTILSINTYATHKNLLIERREVTGDESGV